MSYDIVLERDDGMIAGIEFKANATVTRYDRCAHTFMAAVVITATVSFWL